MVPTAIVLLASRALAVNDWRFAALPIVRNRTFVSVGNAFARRVRIASHRVPFIRVKMAEYVSTKMIITTVNVRPDLMVRIVVFLFVLKIKV